MHPKIKTMKTKINSINVTSEFGHHHIIMHIRKWFAKDYI